MEIRKRIPRKKLRLTRSLGLEQRNVLRLRASFETRLGTVHWLFSRLAPASERAQNWSVAGHKFPRSIEPDLLRSVHRGGGCTGTRAIFKKRRRSKILVITASELFWKSIQSERLGRTLLRLSRVRGALLRERNHWIKPRIEMQLP